MIWLITILQSIALAGPCKATVEQKALQFLEVRAQLAVVAARCPGYSLEIDPESFSRYLSRHKDWTLSSEKWAGEGLKRVTQARASAKSIGEQFYVQKLHESEEVLRSTGAANYCPSQIANYKFWTTLPASDIDHQLAKAVCSRNHSKR